MPVTKSKRPKPSAQRGLALAIGSRLRDAIDDASLSIRTFHQRIAESGVTGSSYPAVHRYLKGKATPPVEFLTVAASILDKRLEWLIGGEAPETAAEHRELVEARARALVRDTKRATSEDARVVAASVHRAGSRVHQERRQLALLRFAAKLDDVGGETLPWRDRGTRNAILERAGYFLTSAEERLGGFAGAVPAIIAPDRRTDGWYATWADAVLDTFARCVLDLGGGTVMEHTIAHAVALRVTTPSPLAVTPAPSDT